MSLLRRCSLLMAAALVAHPAPARAQAGGAEGPDATRVVGRGCPPERALNGEVRLVFIGDSGYGGGVSEWGTSGQSAIASRLNHLELPPDLVFFVGDNVYWTGSSQLYKTRFDDIYEPLIRECKAHVALGNHDVKGCRPADALEHWETCLGELRAATVADRKARYMRQGMEEAKAAEKAQAETAAEMPAELKAEARATFQSNCFPGDATAYQEKAGDTCNSKAALEHAQFGFGSVEKGEPPANERQRYYSVLWPLPKLTKAGAPKEGGPAPPETRPLVDVIVLDSNTLRVDGGVLEEPDGQQRREDRLQLLWLRNAMARWLPAPGETHRIWKILALHHPPYTPLACACSLFGKCIGGHPDEPGLQEQFREALEGLEPPDMMFTGHNHIYARTPALDASGAPATGDARGVRYFVTGGGGAPLYAVRGEDGRFAKVLSIYHFVYLRLTSSSAFFWALDSAGRVRDSGCFDKGSNVDYPLSPDFHYADALPPRCGPDRPAGGTR